MKKYIGFKLIEAEPELAYDGTGAKREGYKVVYPDGYESWSPKGVFENAYMGVPGDGTSITQEMVDNFIVKTVAQTVGEKTTVVHATLANGYEIVESSSCVDPKNYSPTIGAQICIERIRAKVWELLGFLLQTARYGVRRG